VTRIPRLYASLLRYRVAAMVAMFMLLGAAREGPLQLGWRFACAALALASSYVSATALNDLADEEIDKINHPRDAGRPLVEGTGTRHDLSILHLAAAALAVAAALPLGWSGVALVCASLVISHAYSAPPLRFSYRVAGAPLLLAVAYVVVPVGLGIVAARGDPQHTLSRFVFALLLLFAARIVLKDFRDREGDAAFGKPTLLLRHGKDATCAVSAVALLAADAVLVTTLAPVAVVIAQPFVVAIGWMLWRLRHAQEEHAEQVAIGTGARAGNGLLLAMLGWFVLGGAGASFAERVAFAAVLAALFLGSTAALAADPDQAVLGYKG
jgi:4-hydroxybenzoate polyprenyltransferase